MTNPISQGSAPMADAPTGSARLRSVNTCAALEDCAAQQTPRFRTTRLVRIWRGRINPPSCPPPAHHPPRSTPWRPMPRWRPSERRRCISGQNNSQTSADASQRPCQMDGVTMRRSGWSILWAFKALAHPAKARCVAGSRPPLRVRRATPAMAARIAHRTANP